jgi:transcription antitermination factor NusG
MNNQTTNILTQNSELKTQNSIWYALYTKPRWEKKVESLLFQAGYKVYLPLISTIRQWSDRKKKVQVPLINSYVFVQVDERFLNNLLSFQGVLRILKYLGKPARVHSYEINNLKILCQHPGVLLSDKNINVKKGTPVQIIQGAMMGLYGECVEIKGKHRVLVGVKNLGLEFVLNIPLTYIEPLKNPPNPRRGDGA